MATSKKISGGTFPEGFVSPFKRVQMTERNDSALACIATLSCRSLDEIVRIAIECGYPPYGPAWVDNALMTRVLGKVGLSGGEYEPVPSLDALPDVAILMVDYSEALDEGRAICWHHVRGTPQQQAFSYIIDVANWLPEKNHITTDWKHIRFDPAWFIPITPKATRSK